MPDGAPHPEFAALLAEVRAFSRGERLLRIARDMLKKHSGTPATAVRQTAEA